ncbi:hypothetical protein A3H03_03050 [Candidatus Kuenenbacteria bacterium RIFCSPLOWO2_12_FULL_42_13]|uniref:Uncharacterized protein n=4 Tax=Candidatus Kueneniibacteriota TaxID=1752740 RepID=A0A1F6G0K1_9BACT|nr:MAG: hypothetical protein A3C68_01800 [Candidatus Kuenenbacteria bacterium RIFCSPHIGHO2_02_FULL_42_29]OGG91142.1 MAG: hypothetical protein A3H55_02300 [Candidatus Kuenenbacteria bacterium RIFCSPLOWO2_02_FULL_42_16]OGG91641.1 MAG: hypothetical protein A3H03_03050 [Candidatus Kuenenbacteria bacterium RIFCSPLOWO2_12_FULL_42_13]OGG96010.1 MAG: hypothetical protein A2V95_03180 [Candidatus Kuenenbacteria bacterium RBG_16_41_7]OGG98572.1 MAG: hypothetical protein A3E04_01165 [Candidatus Kuenenbacte
MIFASVVLGRGVPRLRDDETRGIQFFLILFFLFFVWIPACAGMTEKVFLGNKCEKFKNTLWIYKQVI